MGYPLGTMMLTMKPPNGGLLINACAAARAPRSRSRHLKSVCMGCSVTAVIPKEGLPWTMFPLRFGGGRKGGRDSHLYLSLMNLGDGVDLRISTQVGRRPEQKQGGASVNICVFWGERGGRGCDEDVM